MNQTKKQIIKNNFENILKKHFKDFFMHCYELLISKKYKLLFELVKKDLKKFNNNPIAISFYTHLVLIFKPNIEIITQCYELLIKTNSVTLQGIPK